MFRLGYGGRGLRGRNVGTGNSRVGSPPGMRAAVLSRAAQHAAWAVAGLGAAGFAGAARAADTPASFTGPNNGFWNSAGNWSGAVVPANSGATTFAVTIPAG